MTAPISDDEQGLSIWVFIVVFAALVTVGLIVVLIVGSPTSDSKPARTATSNPPVRDDPADTDDPARGGDRTTSTSVSVDVTMPDGSSAPEGASSVESADGILTVTFGVDKSQLSSTVLVKVPPMVARPGKGGKQLEVSIGCSSSRREQLSQVVLTETDASVNVAATVLVPTNATGCNPNEPPMELTLPLASDLDGRSVNVQSKDLNLPTIDLDSIDD